jgi:hypothetical protein
VAAALFGTFLSAQNDTAVEVTKDNMRGVFAVCAAVGFNFLSPLFWRSRISTPEVEVMKLRSASEGVRDIQAKLALFTRAIKALATKAESMKTTFIGLSSDVSLVKVWTLSVRRTMAHFGA